MSAKPQPHLIRFKGLTYRLVSAVLPPSDAYLDKITRDLQLEQARQREQERLERSFPESDRPFMPERPRWKQKRKWTTVQPERSVPVRTYPSKSIRIYPGDLELLDAVPHEITDNTYNVFVNNLFDQHEKEKLFSPPSVVPEGGEPPPPSPALVWMSHDEMTSVLDALYAWGDNVPSDKFKQVNRLIMSLEKAGVVPTPPLHSNLPKYDVPRKPSTKWEPGKPLPQTVHLSYKGAIYRRVSSR